MVMASSKSPSHVDWPTYPDQYELMGKIGQGAFASVWRARTVKRGQQGDEENNETGQHPLFTPQECAVKILNLDHVNSNLDEIRLEVQAMRLSSHPNVLACYSAFINETLLWVVTPLMRKGSSIHCLETARRQLAQQQSVVAMEDHILYILHETLLGLQYIHDNGQIHRDIKASNILLDGNGEVKIADFGVCSFLIHSGWSQETKAKTFVGTPCWMAPEVMEQVHGYDYKADIWSLGITALELAMGQAPYAEFPPMKVLILTIQEEPPSLATYKKLDGVERPETDEFSASFQELVQRCLQKDPAQRPLCQELLRSKHFSSYANHPTHRLDRRASMQQEICSLVEDVGEETVSAALPTAGNKNDENDPLLMQQQEQNERPAGTTWIFPEDGSQIVATSSHSMQELEDVLEELDEFGRQTGGENYVARMEQQEQQEQKQQKDDIDQFLNEFEQTTAGEDFRRPP